MKKTFAAVLALITITVAAAVHASAAAKKITEDQAKEIAFKDAGVSADAAERVTVKLEKDDGVSEYDIEFYIGNMEYDYEISAETGKILSKSVDEENERPAPSATEEKTKITREEAKAIAFKDAGIKASEAERVKVKTDHENGVRVYEIEFYAGNTEYEYEISVKDGKILSKSKETKNAAAANAAASKKTSENITKAQAKAIAFKDAGIKASEAKGVKIKTDRENGIKVYEIEFYVGNTEYDYEISVKDGKILSKSKETDDDYAAASKSTGITIEEAKEIALKKVPGAKESNIRIKLDRDDGKTVYEGKIIYNETEYEFEIDASDGRILEWDKESVYD